MRRFIAISLALLMLAISLKVSVDFHYCSGKLAQYKILIGSGKASCGMEEPYNNCKTNSLSFDKSTCCKDELKQIKIDNFHSVDHFSITTLEFIPVIDQINNPSFFKGFEVVNFHNYRPPPDITSVFLPFTGVFLI